MELNADLKAISDTAARFAHEEIRRRLEPESVDKPGFPWEVVKAGASAGYLNAPLPEEYGGAALDHFALVLIIENLAKAAAGPAMVIACHNAAMSVLSQRLEIDAVKEWLASRLTISADDNPPLAAVAIPAAVVDLERPSVPLVNQTEGGLKVTGDFLCLFDPRHADRVALCLPEGCALVKGSDLTPFSATTYSGSGLEECPVARLALEDYKITGDRLLGGNEGDATSPLRLFMAAAMVGTASEATKNARIYAGERFQTGRVIIEHQEVERILSRMDMEMDAARNYLYRAASSGELSAKTAIRLRRFCGDMAENATLFAMQTLGGYGYMKDYGIEKRLRDVKSLQTALGSYVEDWFV